MLGKIFASNRFSQIIMKTSCCKSCSYYSQLIRNPYKLGNQKCWKKNSLQYLWWRGEFIYIVAHSCCFSCVSYNYILMQKSVCTSVYCGNWVHLWRQVQIVLLCGSQEVSTDSDFVVYHKFTCLFFNQPANNQPTKQPACSLDRSPIQLINQLVWLVKNISH